VLDYIRINRLKETDVDEVVLSAGGARLICDGPNKPPNADYILNEAIVELKLVEEEGLKKSERRGKIAELFKLTQPSRPLVVIDPRVLTPEDNRRYYNLLARPIQTAIRKAAAQLDETEKNTHCDATKVLLIINNGYSALSPEEFNSMVAKSLRHDTTKVDHAIVGGIYYYSDTFDSYVISHFEHVPVNVAKPFPSYNALLDSWNQWLQKFMTSMVIRKSVDLTGKFPVVDLWFEVDGIEYLKPAPRMGTPSKFWSNGKRPRTNSTGITKCPPVATCFPKLTEGEWQRFCSVFSDKKKLKSSYPEWLKSARESQVEADEPLRPFVQVPVTIEGFTQWANLAKRKATFDSLCKYSVEVFQELIQAVLGDAKDISTVSVLPTTYVLLIVDEIGQDKANDISSIYAVSSLPGFERETPLIENKKIFFEHSLGLAAAYAIRDETPFIFYELDQTYRWI
jgi:hypothetical protein